MSDTNGDNEQEVVEDMAVACSGGGDSQAKGSVDSAPAASDSETKSTTIDASETDGSKRKSGGCVERFLSLLKVPVGALLLAVGVGFAFGEGIFSFESMVTLTWKMVFDAPPGFQLRHFVLIGIVILCSLFLILLTLHLAFRLFETLAVAEEDGKRRKAKLEEEMVKFLMHQKISSFLRGKEGTAKKLDNDSSSSDTTGSSTDAAGGTVKGAPNV